jgi:hypothetical protein
MKTLAIVLLVLALTVPVAARDIGNATVTLLSPTMVSPGNTYMFTFFVQNASPDAEWITNVEIHFPFGAGTSANQASMGYTFIATGRPSWTMTVWPTVPTALWADNDGGYGEIYSTEGTDVWVDVTLPAVMTGTQIQWELWGDLYGAEPHYVTGYIDVVVTAVEQQTWTAIKSLYR